MRRKVVLLQGGDSEEREVSLQSSAAIHQALCELGYESIPLDPADYSDYQKLSEAIVSISPYIVFIGLHGGEGENGSLQALLSLLDIPFTGSDMKSSALCMDKLISFALAKSLGVRIPDYVALERRDYEIDSLRPGEETRSYEEKIAGLEFPLVVKPNDSGSSVGITIVPDLSQLAAAIDEAFRYGKSIIIQRFIAGSELTVSVLGSQALPVVEIKVKEGWYDYRNKYTSGRTVYEVPAKLSHRETELIRKQSLDIFKSFGCCSYARIDFRYDGRNFYFLEVNTLPGMTSLSLTPMAAKAAGYSFPEMIDRIIKESIERYQEERARMKRKRD